mmetsp:Transcript_29047/g.54571  ORF Transcript_29047/g.54571 Transcript_29047/m.54571 type:complete len:207 (-) Transcript_29047:1855-2475(-)
MTPMPTDPAEARKRRKEIIQSQRLEGEASPETTAKNTTKVAAGPKAKESQPTNTNGTNASDGAEKKPPKKRKVGSDDSSSEKTEETPKSGKNSSEDSKKKTQIRYDPDVPMNKDQLAAWRREARRVRNRESAAASRQRIRNRIAELEEEVGQWKTKYAQAVQRLEALEAVIANQEPGGAGASAAAAAEEGGKKETSSTAAAKSADV